MVQQAQIVTGHDDDSQTIIGWDLGSDEAEIARQQLEHVLGSPHYQVIIPGKLKPELLDAFNQHAVVFGDRDV